MFTVKRILVLIILLGIMFRIYGVNWDQGFHLHPDERAIVMTVVKLSPPVNFSQFVSPESPWNPKFFAYGSFPMYLLYFAGQAMSHVDPKFADYILINIVGRYISALFDAGTIILLFFIGKKLFRPGVGLFAAFLYAVSALPIQLSHFFAVDTILTFFITASLYILIRFYEKPTVFKSLLLGICFGLALATKVSAIVVAISIFAALFIDTLIALIRHPKKPRLYMPHLWTAVQYTLTYGVVAGAAALAAFAITEPYAVIDNKTFWEQTLYQSMMTKDAFVFPYTLQYVGKIPYLYELQNIFLFGLGPVIASLSFLGLGYTIMLAFREKEKKLPEKLLPSLVFFISYFWVVGGFAIGFMRYMLPVYPLICLFGGVLLYQLYKTSQAKVKTKPLLVSMQLACLIILLVWPLSFVNMYGGNNTRYDATAWINEHIRPGDSIAIEHWDDGLPLTGQEKYTVLTLALYEPDTPEKWAIVKNQLEQTNYIIIASNRLYTPLQKLTDCAKLRPGKCYQQTASYYQKLFSGQLGFTKVAEFSDYPTVPLLNIPINDQSADESFTVYDHPKVMIFQKTSPVNL